jgi:hypothetical protein
LGETGGQHDRRVDPAAADRRERLVNTVLIPQQGCGHPVVPRRGGGGPAGAVQRVRAPATVTQPSVLVGLVGGAGRDRSLRRLGAGQKLDAGSHAECRSVDHNAKSVSPERRATSCRRPHRPLPWPLPLVGANAVAWVMAVVIGQLRLSTRDGIWLLSRDGHDLCSESVGEGCLAVTQPRRRVVTDGRAAPTLEEGSPWPSCSM